MDLGFSPEYLYNSREGEICHEFLLSDEFKWVEENCQSDIKFTLSLGKKIFENKYWHDICGILLIRNHTGKYFLDNKEFSGICKYCSQSYPRASSLQGLTARAIPIEKEKYLSKYILNCCIDCEKNLQLVYPDVAKLVKQQIFNIWLKNVQEKYQHRDIKAFRNIEEIILNFL